MLFSVFKVFASTIIHFLSYFIHYVINEKYVAKVFSPSFCSKLWVYISNYLIVNDNILFFMFANSISNTEGYCWYFSKIVLNWENSCRLFNFPFDQYHKWKVDLMKSIYCIWVYSHLSVLFGCNWYLQLLCPSLLNIINRVINRSN